MGDAQQEQSQIKKANDLFQILELKLGGRIFSIRPLGNRLAVLYLSKWSKKVKAWGVTKKDTEAQAAEKMEPYWDEAYELVYEYGGDQFDEDAHEWIDQLATPEELGIAMGAIFDQANFQMGLGARSPTKKEDLVSTGPRNVGKKRTKKKPR